ncbi:MAG: hypothetical protein VCE91_16950 [Nitrospinota bacterium]
MRKTCTILAVALALALAAPQAATKQIAKKKTVTPPAFFFTRGETAPSSTP